MSIARDELIVRAVTGRKKAALPRCIDFDEDVKIASMPAARDMFRLVSV
jgi:hypothetical protein